MSIPNKTDVEPSESHQMKVLIVYDSVYGNTEKVAKAIGDAITGEVKVLRVGELNSSELKTFDLLIVGSPTQGVDRRRRFKTSLTEFRRLLLGVSMWLRSIPDSRRDWSESLAMPQQESLTV